MPQKSQLSWAGVALGIVVLCGGVVVLLREGSRRAQLERRIAGRIDELTGAAAERPSLRGEPIDGNAYEAQLGAMMPLRDLPGPFADFTRQLEDNHVAPDLQELARARAPALVALRHTIRHCEPGSAPRPGSITPSVAPNRYAWQLILVAALAAPAPECLEAVADAMRLAQDLATGLGLVGKGVEASFAYDFAVAMVRCASLASPDELAVAAKELAILRESSPPIGPAIELEILGRASTRVELDARESWLAESGSWHALDAERDLGTMLEKAQAHDQHVESIAPDLAGVTLRSHVSHEGERVALLRMVHVALMSDRMGAGARELADPWTGQPLQSRSLASGAVLLWSVGPDGNDAGGLHGSDDISLELPAR